MYFRIPLHLIYWNWREILIFSTFFVRFGKICGFSKKYLFFYLKNIGFLSQYLWIRFITLQRSSCSLDIQFNIQIQQNLIQMYTIIEVYLFLLLLVVVLFLISSFFYYWFSSSSLVVALYELWGPCRYFGGKSPQFSSRTNIWPGKVFKILTVKSYAGNLAGALRNHL